MIPIALDGLTLDLVCSFLFGSSEKARYLHSRHNSVLSHAFISFTYAISVSDALFLPGTIRTQHKQALLNALEAARIQIIDGHHSKEYLAKRGSQISIEFSRNDFAEPRKLLLSMLHERFHVLRELLTWEINAFSKDYDAGQWPAHYRAMEDLQGAINRTGRIRGSSKLEYSRYTHGSDQTPLESELTYLKKDVLEPRKLDEGVTSQALAYLSARFSEFACNVMGNHTQIGMEYRLDHRTGIYEYLPSSTRAGLFPSLEGESASFQEFFGLPLRLGMVEKVIETAPSRRTFVASVVTRTRSMGCPDMKARLYEAIRKDRRDIANRLSEQFNDGRVVSTGILRPGCAAEHFPVDLKASAVGSRWGSDLAGIIDSAKNATSTDHTADSISKVLSRLAESE